MTKLSDAYREPTQEAGRDLLMRGIDGELVMLNLLASASRRTTPQLRILSGSARFVADLGLD